MEELFKQVDFKGTHWNDLTEDQKVELINTLTQDDEIFGAIKPNALREMFDSAAASGDLPIYAVDVDGRLHLELISLAWVPPTIIQSFVLEYAKSKVMEQITTRSVEFSSATGNIEQLLMNILPFLNNE